MLREYILILSCQMYFLLLYADDMVNIADTVGRLQNQINILAEFCYKYGMKVNLDKTKIMVFRRGGPLRKNEKWFYNGQRVETVSEYKYLGTVFSSRLSWNSCKRHLVSQARKGMFMLKRFINLYNINAKTSLYLFDHMIAPILFYGADIWGYEYSKCIESVQTDFCKFILGVNSRTSNVAVLGELGRYPLSVEHSHRCIKYWLKILEMGDDRYPFKCYKMLFDLDINGRITWATCIKNLLNNLGFGEVWLSQGVGNTQVFLLNL